MYENEVEVSLAWSLELGACYTRTRILFCATKNDLEERLQLSATRVEKVDSGAKMGKKSVRSEKKKNEKKREERRKGNKMSVWCGVGD